MTKVGRHCWVSGRVQGVFYRQKAKQQALVNNITGWVKNLVDGRVETMLFGDLNNVKHMITWLTKGPLGAKVTHIEIEEIPVMELLTFEILK